MGPVDVSHEGNVLVVRGALDVRCTAELREHLYALLDEVGGTVVVDVTEVESVDMTALKLLAVANRVAGRRGGRVVLRGASSGVRRLLHLSHLRAMVPLEQPVAPRPASTPLTDQAPAPRGPLASL